MYMTGAELVRFMLAETDTTIKALAEMYGRNYRTLRNKLSLNSFTFEEIQQIADVLGFDIQAIKRE